MRSLGHGSPAHPAARSSALADACAVAFEEESRRLFVDVVQRQLIAAGGGSAPRPVFRKAHGVAFGTLRIDPGLPDRYRHGLLALREMPAWVRFSSDAAPTTSDGAGSTLGIGIKLFYVGGPSLDEDDPASGTADLLMQNHDRFFVATGQEFCAFSHAAVLGNLDAWLADHPETAEVLAEMVKREPSVLGATYWSVLPYACGPEAKIKYRLTPLDHVAADPAPPDESDFLRQDLARRLAAAVARFELAVQPFTTNDETPLDLATVRWPTPFQRVGELVLARQDVDAPGQATYGENLSLRPWRTMPQNRPLGSIAASRQLTYRSAANLRRSVNGVPTPEPNRPR